MNFEHLRLENRDGIVTLVIHRPEKLNALDSGVLEELGRCCHALGVDSAAKALIVTGAGEKAFVAGADVAHLARQDVRGLREASRQGQEVLSLLAALPMPTCAAINGYALGGGLELALACHFRVAQEGARLGLPEVGLGLIPGYGGTQRLPRLIGYGRALEMILTGRQVSADEALAVGLITRTAPKGQAVEGARALLLEVLRNSPAAVASALDAVRRGLAGSLHEGLTIERDLFAMCGATQDMKEGTSAFLDKRKPQFTGR